MDEPGHDARGLELNDNAQPVRAPDVCTHLCTALRSVLKDELDQHPMPNEHVELLLALRHKERDRTRRRFA
jgi:hypothetical protein